MSRGGFRNNWEEVVAPPMAAVDITLIVFVI